MRLLVPCIFGWIAPVSERTIEERELGNGSAKVRWVGRSGAAVLISAVELVMALSSSLVN